MDWETNPFIKLVSIICSLKIKFNYGKFNFTRKLLLLSNPESLQRNVCSSKRISEMTRFTWDDDNTYNTLLYAHFNPLISFCVYHLYFCTNFALINYSKSTKFQQIKVIQKLYQLYQVINYHLFLVESWVSLYMMAMTLPKVDL